MPISPSRPYRVGAEALFEATAGRSSEQHRATMGDMIGRYAITGKRVLCVGPGTAAQEYWLHRAGNSLVFVDIDEHGRLEPLLAAAAEGTRDETDCVTYVIGDACEPGAWLDEPFDVLFMSGWTPDEFHRVAAAAAFAGTWPSDVGPLSPACAGIVARGLAADGLFLMLSYASGPDVIRARPYLPGLEAQLRGLGLALLEVHCLATTPGIHLVAAVRSSGAALAARVEALRARPPIRELHARGDCDHTAVRVFPGPLRAAEADGARLAALLLGPDAERLEHHMAPMLARFAPDAARVWYAGAYPDTEGFYLLSRGLAVELGGEGDTRAAAEPVDLCLLSFPAADESLREATVASGLGAGARFFDPQSLAAAAARLEPEGVLLYQGRSGGIDLTAYPAVLARMAAELSQHGLVLHELFVLRAVPGIFLLAAGRQALGPLPPAPGFRFFAHSMLDTLAERVWPRRDPRALPDGTFVVRPEALARRLAVEELVERCVPVVRQLVDRFDLAGRTMLSIGPGAGNEEIAMLRCGVARAHFVDIDEHGTLAAHLAAIHEPETAEAPIRYRLGNFCAESARLRQGIGRVGFLYVSSFTPDELRRADIAGVHRRGRLATRLARGYVDWPPDASPLHDSLREAVDLDLADDGVFVLQSIYGGIDPRVNPGYVAQWREVLAAHHVHLLEAYCLRAAAGATVWIGRKLLPGGREVGARLEAVRRTLASRPPLTRFHARAQLEDTAVIRFYPPPAPEP